MDVERTWCVNDEHAERTRLTVRIDITKWVPSYQNHCLNIFSILLPSFAMITTLSKKEFGEGRVYLTNSYNPLSREAKAGTQIRGSDHGDMLLTGFFTMACSAYFFIQTRNTCQAVLQPTVGLALPHELLICKMPPWTCLHDEKVKTPSSHNPGLCQVDKNLASTLCSNY